jgi:hypothetical protein
MLRWATQKCRTEPRHRVEARLDMGEGAEPIEAARGKIKELFRNRVNDGQALAFLQDRDRDFLKGILIEEEGGEAANEMAADAAE